MTKRTSILIASLNREHWSKSLGGIDVREINKKSHKWILADILDDPGSTNILCHRIYNNMDSSIKLPKETYFIIISVIIFLN